MPTLSFDQLMSSSSRDDAKAKLIDILGTLGVDAASWRKAGVYDTLLTGAAWLYSATTVLLVQAIGAAFLEKAAGSWLRLLAFYVFGIPFEFGAATFATGKEQFTNSGGGVYSYAIGEVSVINSTTGKAYFNAEAFTLNPGDVKLVAIQAKEIGTASNGAPGEVDTLETTILGVTVTNPEAVVGADDMADPDLKTLCSAKLATLSNGGPRKAYLFAVMTATRPDGTLVNINRVSVSPDSSIGVVTIYVAAPAGAPDSLDVGYAQANVEKIARPDGIVATVVAATEVPVTRTLTLYARAVAGLSAADIQAKAYAALVAAIATYPIGGIAIPPVLQGYLFADKVKAIAESADDSVLHATDGGAADTAINAGQVATLAATVNVQIVTVT